MANRMRIIGMRAPAELLVVDAVSAYRYGLRRALEESGGLRVAGEAGSGEEALALAESLRPQVVVVDIHLPDMSGIHLCSRLTQDHRGMAVVVLSTFDWDVYLAGAWEAGASGFLPKEMPEDELVDCLTRVTAGQIFSPEQITRARSWGRVVGGRLAQLGERELEVLGLVAEGCTNREIAARLVLSENTVEKHVGSLLRKLDVTSRTALLAFILQQHLDVLKGIRVP